MRRESNITSPSIHRTAGFDSDPVSRGHRDVLAPTSNPIADISFRHDLVRQTIDTDMTSLVNT